MLEKNSLNDKSLEMNVAISRKKLWVSTHCWNSWMINDTKQKWTKILRTDSVFLGLSVGFLVYAIEY